ncbi:MAG TPA: glycosyltransferase family 2 protein [Verrucomicrobiae bacterium]|nr:glycosyltransferase family 2 protein [Verrucomicrobiae bacterium]
MSPGAPNSLPRLRLYSIVIPARNEEGCIGPMLEAVHAELERNSIAHELVVVDDGSTDKTWPILLELAERQSAVRPVQNLGPHGFGRAVAFGLDQARGDAIALMMADQSDDPKDAVQYWRTLNDGYECVFGSRFLAGSQVVDYPKLKLAINRLANLFIRVLFNFSLNDTTNAFKAYRREVIDGCRPILSPHFNITVELPLKAIVRGYTWKMVPISWRNRRTGESKLKIQEMGSRYLFICLYVWLEKYFSRGDYHRNER